MRILIDIGHPGHVHLFRPFAKEMMSRGHKVLFTCREKEFEKELLNAEGFLYVSFGKKHKSILGKMFGLLKFDFLELKTALKFKPDIFLSHGSPYAAHAAFFLRKPHISFEDTFNFEQIRFYKPFTDSILTSTYNHPYIGKNNLHYSGYHELAYLHPAVFTPDSGVIKELGLNTDEKYVIIRLVSWSATHDLGHKGISYQNKILAVETISQYAKVFISSENPLPAELEKYKFPLKPDRMHHAISFACLLYGESATMATEAAVLGVPSIYIDNTSRFYTKDIQNKYQIIFNFSESDTDQKLSIERAIELINTPKENWAQRRRRILNDNINVTEFLIWFIEKYPESRSVLRNNPSYEIRFK